MEQFIIKPFADLTLRELHAAVEAREEVFFLEQRITDFDADDADFASTYLWSERDGRMAAFLRMIPAGVVGADASIGRVLVRKPYRRQGICRRMMLRATEYMLVEWNCHSITISAQTYLIGFYASLGFKVTSEEFMDASLPHVKMHLTM